MKYKGLQLVVVVSILLSPWFASPGSGIGMPPILNSKITDDTGTYYWGGDDGSFWWMDCESYQGVAAWSFYEGESWPRIPCDGCSSYVAFGTWYYQDCLYNTSEDLVYSDFDMEVAPLYLDNWDAAYSAPGSPAPPTPLNVKASFYPFDGLDALRYIPVPACGSARLPVAAARYGINIETSGTYDPATTAVGALFWITAEYDASVFDVCVSNWWHSYVDVGSLYSSARTPTVQSCSSVVPGGSLWRDLCANPFSWYTDDLPLPSESPLMFHDEPVVRYVSGHDMRRRALPITPDFVTIRVKDGIRLEDLGGRKVKMILHTLSWAGDRSWCSPSGDAFHYTRTATILVGADLDEHTNDWRIEPAALKDECIPPSFSKTDDKSAEADIIGTQVIKDLNAVLPSMRVGQTRCNVAHTLSTTLANNEIFHCFGKTPASGFIATDVLGVPCAVEDVPGWSCRMAYNLWCDADVLEIRDGINNLAYIFLAGDNDGDGLVTWYDYFTNINDDSYVPNACDYSGYPAKLIEVLVDNTSETVRLYDYGADPDHINGDIHENLLYQVDTADNYIQYLYETVSNGTSNDLRITLSGNGERSIAATFGAQPIVPNDPRTCPLIACTNGSVACRQYDWYPIATPPTAYDGKLRSIRGIDANGTSVVLAGFVYDDSGRLIRQTRGNEDPPQLVAEYIYPTLAATQPGGTLPDYTMDARFYVDDAGLAGHYQLVRRTFTPQGQVTQSEEFHDVQEAGSVAGPQSLTTFDYCHPPTDWDGQDSFFYELYDDYHFYYLIPVGRCVIKTLPANHAGLHVAEYTQYEANKGFNVSQTFLAPPPSISEGAMVEPAAEDRCNWMVYSYSNGTSHGIWQKLYQYDMSHGDAATPNTVKTQFSYHTAEVPAEQVDPVTIEGVSDPESRMFQTWEYVHDDAWRYDYSKVRKHARTGPNGKAIATVYDYDTCGNMIQKTEGPAFDHYSEPTPLLTWNYSYNAFGQKVTETDPDGFIHGTDYDSSTGLVAGTWVCDPYDPNLYVVQQTRYVYENGLLTTVHVADNPGPFPIDNPVSWIDTQYTYDAYSRLTSKTVTGKVLAGDLTTHNEPYTTQYAYDRQDRLVKVTWPDGRRKEITRDGRGQITQMEYYGTGGDKLTSTYTYDDAGNLTRRTTEGCPECGKSTRYEYDRYNRRIKEIREVAQ